MPDPGVFLAVNRVRLGRPPAGTIKDPENALDLASSGYPADTTLEPPWVE